MASQVEAVEAETVGNRADVIDQDRERVVFGRGGARVRAVAALVECDDAEAQRDELVCDGRPVVEATADAVRENDERPIAALDDIMSGDATPAQKLAPAPSSTTALTVRSAASWFPAFASASNIRRSTALCLSGRFSVTTAM